MSDSLFFVSITLYTIPAVTPSHLMVLIDCAWPPCYSLRLLLVVRFGPSDSISLYFCFLHIKKQRFAARVTCDVVVKEPEILPDLQSKHYLYCYHC